MSTDRCYDSHIAAVDVGLTEESLSGVEEYSLQNEPKLLLSIPRTKPIGVNLASRSLCLLHYLWEKKFYSNDFCGSLSEQELMT
jgi:hypothetical protein